MRHSRYIVVSVLVLLSVAAAPGSVAPAGEVNAWGALRAMMHEGATGPVVSLKELLPDTTVYAVGALAELSGEITILAGTVYLSRAQGEGAVTEVTHRSDAEAALLVASSVTRWQEVVTEAPIPYGSIDAEIGRLALAAGIDTGSRFVFVVEGMVEELEWHVIDGSRLDAGPSSHEAHRAAGVANRRERVPAALVGFYSESDQGVFTHMGSKTHVHCVVEKGKASGHVDHVVVPEGTTVRFGMGD